MPRALWALWDGWKRVARRIGDVQARILLTGFYFLVLGPPALLLRWRADPLALRPGGARGWTPHEAASEPALARAHRQS